MKVISILNHKGGVGKSTIATNLAGYFANNGGNVLLGDFDIQKSSQNWLSLRNAHENLAPIKTWDVSNGKIMAPSSDTTHVIIDSPAGLRDDSLRRLLSMSNKVITPLRPSTFDMMSTGSFLEEIIEMINAQEKTIDLCVIPSMVEHNTKSSEKLNQFIAKLGLDSPMSVRQAQIYVHLAAHGFSLFDSKNKTLERDVVQWQPLIKWIES